MFVFSRSDLKFTEADLLKFLKDLALCQNLYKSQTSTILVCTISGSGVSFTLQRDMLHDSATTNVIKLVNIFREEWALA